MKSILFNTEMVRSIREDRKTVTRRLIKNAPVDYEFGGWLMDSGNGKSYSIGWLQKEGCKSFPFKTKYLKGDILYVKETWKLSGIVEDIGLMVFRYKETDKVFRDGYVEDDRFQKLSKFMYKKGWQPSLFMPQEAARIFLRVKDVKIERLSDITEEQAIKEGFLPVYKCEEDAPSILEYCAYCAKTSFLNKFYDIYSNDNLYLSNKAHVLVYEFEVISEDEAYGR